MSKLIAALKRTLTPSDDQDLPVHFHQGTSDAFPEVCYDGACPRPHLQPR